MEFPKHLPDDPSRLVIVKFGPDDIEGRTKMGPNSEGSVWVVRGSEWDIRERCQVVALQRVDGSKR